MHLLNTREPHPNAGNLTSAPDKGQDLDPDEVNDSGREMTASRRDASRPDVVIVGAGFAGLNAAQKLRRVRCNVTIVDRQNYHLFQPLLYQVATAGLNPGDIASPIRGIVANNPQANVILGEVESIDRQNRSVHLQNRTLHYDYLIVAAGMTNNYFGHQDRWSEFAPGLKGLDEALDLRQRILMAFEAAEQSRDPEEVEALMTFVVVGGGPTGVEMAGAISEISRHVIDRDFRAIDPQKARIVLIEGLDRVLPTFSPHSSQKALEALRERDVEVHLETFVEEIDEAGVRAGELCIRCRTVIWGAGLQAVPMVATLGVEQDKSGRIAVEPDLSLSDDSRVYIVGDLCLFEHDDRFEDGLPGLAPVAIQEGKWAASNIKRDIEGRPRKPFSYVDKGQMATIGRHAAVAEVKSWKFGGYFAWLAWLFVHIFFLVGFRNRLMVFLNWVYQYIAFRRGARLIVNRPRSPQLIESNSSATAQSPKRKGQPATQLLD